MPVLANTGVGFVMITAPLGILMLVPVILVEAMVLARMLPSPARSALVHSGSVNVASTLVGAVAGFAIDATGVLGSHEPTRMPALLSLLPLFLVSWVVEDLVLRSRIPPATLPARRRMAATLAANALSCAMMAVAVLVTFPHKGEYVSRSTFTEVLNILGIEKSSVAEHHQIHGRFPPPGRVEASYGASRYIQRLSRGEGGRIVAELGGAPDLVGRRIMYTPRLAAPGGPIVEWDCSTDAPHRYVPPACRNPLALP